MNEVYNVWMIFAHTHRPLISQVIKLGTGVSQISTAVIRDLLLVNISRIDTSIIWLQFRYTSKMTFFLKEKKETKFELYYLKKCSLNYSRNY